LIQDGIKMGRMTGAQRGVTVDAMAELLRRGQSWEEEDGRRQNRFEWGESTRKCQKKRGLRAMTGGLVASLCVFH